MLHSLKQTIKRHYSLSNIVIVVAVLIALSWLWGTIGALQRNYALQADIDLRRQEVELLELEAKNLALQNEYYKTDEYLELAARDRLDKAQPGEKVLLLPPNSASSPIAAPGQQQKQPGQPRNFELWMDFLFGGARRQS